MIDFEIVSLSLYGANTSVSTWTLVLTGFLQQLLGGLLLLLSHFLNTKFLAFGGEVPLDTNVPPNFTSLPHSGTWNKTFVPKMSISRHFGSI